jgi:hypothetical protein
VFPLVPFLALIAIFGGGATLIWYDQLNAEQQQEADRIACGYAKQIFNKSLEDLTKEQAKHVAMLTKQHFVN